MFLWYPPQCDMEELKMRWKKLSLLEAEGKKHDLSKEKRTAEYVLAVKFFTRRSINVEAVARTFRPLWRTKRNFEVSMAGDNVVLIAFEWEVDAKKVIEGEPWMFGRHLVVLQRYRAGHRPRPFRQSPRPLLDKGSKGKN